MNKHPLFSAVLVFVLSLAFANTGIAQTRITLNNDPFVVMDGGVFIVIDNANANAISLSGTGGNIISEDEDNKIRWNIGTSTGTYVIPFTSEAPSQAKVPLTVNVSAAGAGGTGRLDLSTYYTTTANNSPWMSLVIHMNDAATGATNNTNFVLDRWWYIDAANYTTKPTMALTFTYRDLEHTQSTNTIGEANLRAQRFDDGAGAWEGALFGSANTVNNTVTTSAIAPANFFASWVLSDASSPLPVDLLAFDADCIDEDVVVTWTTASETDNMLFTVERSIDNLTFEEVGSIPGALNSNTTLHYEFKDSNPLPGQTYYRIRQTNFNSNSQTFAAQPVYSCDDGLFDVSVFQNGSGQIDLGLTAEEDQTVVITIHDLSGRVVHRQNVSSKEGYNAISLNHQSLSFGFYMLSVEGKRNRFAQKVLLK